MHEVGDWYVRLDTEIDGSGISLETLKRFSLTEKTKVVVVERKTSKRKKKSSNTFVLVLNVVRHA